MEASEELIRAFREALGAYLINKSGLGWGYGGEPSSNLHSESMLISRVFIAVEASPDSQVRIDDNEHFGNNPGEAMRN
jgi:hypothetical protein